MYRLAQKEVSSSAGLPPSVKAVRPTPRLCNLKSNLWIFLIHKN
ncbi:hypothetical protein [Moraxella lacunata]|nr:hypothetical protein [Moraxella lacunata]